MVICSYNAAATLSAALHSLEAQTLPTDFFEVIVVDDGSTDSTSTLVGKFRARYLRNTSNRGLPASCNRGLAEALGKYFIRLDADDVFAPTILSTMLPLIESMKTDMVSCDRYELPAHSLERREVRLDSFDIYKLIAIGVMMRRDLLLAIGGYRAMFWEEYDLFIRYLIKSGKAPRHVGEPLLTYTRRAQGMTASPDRVRTGWKEFMSQWPLETARRFGTLPPEAIQDVGFRVPSDEA